jgi:hypothetical protein
MSNNLFARFRSRLSLYGDSVRHRPSAYAPTSFIRYENFRHLRASVLLLLICSAFYFYNGTSEASRGGTLLGLTLGSLSALIVLWLMWIGVAKRARFRVGRRMWAWTSAHIYFGPLLLVLVPLHSGFELDWNVHGFAYAAIVAVVLTGVVGVVLYGTLPVPMSRNRGGQKFDHLLQQIADVDAECKAVVCDLPDDYARAIANSIDGTRIGGGLRRQLSANADTRSADEALQAIHSLALRENDEARSVQQLIKLLAQKRSLLERVHRHLNYRALLELWLILHVPLAFAALSLVAIHVFVVLYYA